MIMSDVVVRKNKLVYKISKALSVLLSIISLLQTFLLVTKPAVMKLERT